MLDLVKVVNPVSSLELDVMVGVLLVGWHVGEEVVSSTVEEFDLLVLSLSLDCDGRAIVVAHRDLNDRLELLLYEGSDQVQVVLVSVLGLQHLPQMLL